MKVVFRLGLGFGTLILLLVGILLYQLSVVHQAVQTNRELSAIISRLALTSTDQVGLLDRLQENASKYVVTLEPGYAARYEEAQEAFDRTVHRLRALPLTGAEREEVAELAVLWDAHLRRSPTLEARALQATVGDLSTPMEEIARDVNRLRAQTRQVTRASQEAMTTQVRRSAAAARRAERISWLAAAGAVILGLLVSWRIVRSISTSLGRLKHGTRKVAEGDFSYRLTAPRDDDFAQVSRDFNVMTERLGELDRAKRDFLSQVSHDLKTPLASMQETGQVLLEGLAGPVNEKQADLLRMNLRSARRLSAMIAKLLDLARMDAGAMEYEFRQRDLASLIRAVMEEYGPRAGEHGVQLAAALDEEPLSMECDADRLIQVVANLVENALKFSPPGARVVVGLRATTSPARRNGGTPPPGVGGSAAAGWAVLTVSDRGPGVPDDEKEAIFERFRQARGPAAARGGGVGLGLALCREIVTAHRGRIWVEDRPGGGSRFIVQLPRAVTERTQARRVATAGAGARG